MAFINENYLKLKAGYLFPEIARRVRVWSEENPDVSDLIRCGIGDVTEPLPQSAIDAMKAATDELGARETFRGYGPEQGYDFLREAIAQHDYQARGIEITADEIFISDGSKCDTANILDIFGDDNRIAITDPVYPVYVDTNVMAGHTGEADESGAYAGLHYLPCTPENNFVARPPDFPVDIVYLCFPNNPTGSVATREQLQEWVSYAKQHKAIIFFDAAYGDYISDPNIPRSIFEIEGATECAIEFRSFSKNGGFTGVRCALTVVPKALHGQTRDGQASPIHPLWLRRSTTKFNGVSYPVQRAAEALYSTQGREEVSQLISHYMGNAEILRTAAAQCGLKVWGGEHAPCIWIQAPAGFSSWDVFDAMLHQAHVVVTPGSGFGKQGEGFFRISAFNSRANVEEVARRLGENVMESLKIVVLDASPLSESSNDWNALREIGKVEVFERSDAAQVLARITEADILITNKCRIAREQFEAAPQLKFIAETATGTDNLDLVAARERGIVVSNVPSYSSDFTAQTAWALLLELTHHCGAHSQMVHDGAWSNSPDFSFWKFPLVELSGQTLLLLGTGNIGNKVGHIARAFGMQVLAGVLPGRENAPQGEWERVSLEDGLRRADVVSLHCPATPQTLNLMNEERLNWMKPTAFLINTARGKLVDEKVLCKYLQQGRIAGFAADVLSSEPPPHDHPLIGAPNCILTPHLGWASVPARKRALKTTLENVRAWHKNRAQNVVT